MKHILFLFLAVSLSFSLCAAGRLTVIDGGDGTPLVAATVFSHSGIIIGLTDKDGSISGIPSADYPLTVKCLGYKEATCTQAESTVRLDPALYELAGMTVTPLDRPIMRVLCYVREYTNTVSSADTFQMFAEHMAHIYIPTAKVKKFKKATSPIRRRTIQFIRMANSKRDSIYTPDYYDDTFEWMDFVELPEKSEEPQQLRDGAQQHAEQGKHGVKTVFRKGANSYIETVDFLADKKGHRMSPAFLKLLGMTIELDEMTGSWAWQPNDKGVYRTSDIVSGTFSLSATASGRWLKKALNSKTPVKMKVFFELYPVAFEHMTVEQAKKEIKEGASAKWKRSPQAPPLAPSVQHIVDTVREQKKK